MGFKSEIDPKAELLSQSGDSGAEMYRSARRLFPPMPDSCELTIECNRDQYSASAIGRAVEDADAHLLNLNVTSVDNGPDRLTVDLRVSHRNAGSVARSLERYGYTVTGTRGGHDTELENMRRRIDELMTCIEL